MDKVSTLNEKVTRKEVSDDLFVVQEFIEYLRQIAETDESYSLTAGQIWKLYDQIVRHGMFWPKVAKNLGLPDPGWLGSKT